MGEVTTGANNMQACYSVKPCRSDFANVVLDSYCKVKE